MGEKNTDLNPEFVLPPEKGVWYISKDKDWVNTELGKIRELVRLKGLETEERPTLMLVEKFAQLIGDNEEMVNGKDGAIFGVDMEFGGNKYRLNLETPDISNVPKSPNLKGQNVYRISLTQADPTLRAMGERNHDLRKGEIAYEKIAFGVGDGGDVNVNAFIERHPDFKGKGFGLALILCKHLSIGVMVKRQQEVWPDKNISKIESHMYDSSSGDFISRFANLLNHKSEAVNPRDAYDYKCEYLLV